MKNSCENIYVEDRYLPHRGSNETKSLCKWDSLPRSPAVKSANLIIRRWCIFSISRDKRQSNLWNNLDTQDFEAIQDKSETHARCQHPLAKIDMIHITILEPEGMSIFEESDA